MVLEEPAPFLQPVMQITASPDLRKPLFFPKSTPNWMRLSTSLIQSSGLGSVKTK